MSYEDSELLSLGPVVRHIAAQVARVRQEPKIANNIVGRLSVGTELIGLVVEGEAVEGDRRWLLLGEGRYVHMSVVQP